MEITSEMSNLLNTFGYVRCKYNNQIFVITTIKALVNSFDTIVFGDTEYRKIKDIEKAIKIKKDFQDFFGFVEIRNI